MTEADRPQAEIDERNADFWSELCGTNLAQSLGIQGDGPDDLARFDAAYMAMYPYLERYIDELTLTEARVLEIGLGFGTMGSVLARRSGEYNGVDIAPGPVQMMRHRLQLEGHSSPETAVVVGSALELPYPENSFDRVVSIGCLHHTGDLETSFREVDRVLAPRGRALIMVYNRHSFRRTVGFPIRRLVAFARKRAHGASWERGRYDTNVHGVAAPHTDFVSRRELRQLLRPFPSVRIETQNADPLSINGRTLIPRERLLGPVGRTVGLDLYALATR